MCAKSSRLTTTSDTIGELLHELEEKMEVCIHLGQQKNHFILSVGYNSPSLIIFCFLHVLHTRQVARIQLQISEALKLQPQTQPMKSAIRKLDAQLVDISTLYGEYADTFELSECKLAIVHCAGHYDPTLIESLWREIIDNGTFMKE